MSIQQLLLGAAGASGYNLQRSVRLRSSASGYFSRAAYSVASAGTKYTMSMWVKRGTLGTGNLFAFVATTGAAQQAGMMFDSNNNIRWWQYAPSTYQFHKITTAVFRDPSAWYHLVFSYDTTLATASDRCQVWVNGVRQTAFSTSIDPSLNLVTYYKTGQLYPYIGAENRDNTYLNGFDGYLAETYFIDGQALTPASFGSTNALTGVWQPAPYTGTYGTNGFYLKFTDNSTAAALGTDFSGNSNTWTVNNISVTAGVTYDSMTDVPTLTSATASNYCVFNAAAQSTVVNGTVTRSNGNLTSTDGGTTYGLASYGTIASTTGKWYWEVTLTSAGGTLATIGVVDLNQPLGTNLHTGIIYAQGGNKGTGSGVFGGGGSTAYGATYTTGDVIAVALDLDGGSITFYKNGVSQGVAYTGISGNYTPGVGDAQNTTAYTFDLNCGQRPFTYTPPTGFVALNTFNLAASTIVKGNVQMDATLYTGNGSTLAVTNAGGMQPDFVWVKNRGATTSHVLQDSVRGAGKSLFSNATSAESGNAGDLIASFNSNGFTVNDTFLGGSGGGGTNGASGSYVAWQWKAGGAAVTNTAGSISAQVSANPTAGFSVVTYTGTGSAATIGHGLGVAPKMVIAKSRSNAGGDSGIWVVYHASLTSASYFLYLNQTDGQTLATTVWNATAPTSSVFSVGTASGSGTASTHVAYCFADIDGFSKFGGYTGNGSTDGAFIYTGFRPRFVLVKQTNAVGNWIIWDTARSTFNQMQLYLSPNNNSQELNNVLVSIDALSNGFKCRTSDNDINGSGDTYIYMAFAENPFKNALAR